jgi:hypothetical protein
MMVALAVAPAASARAPQNVERQASGAIEGRVTDAATGDPLPGAKVMVADTAAEASTDREGRFRLSAVPSGGHSVVITYLGRADVVAETTVIAGAARKLDVQMSATAFEETVTVRGELIQAAQERALNQQKPRRISPTSSRLIRLDRFPIAMLPKPRSGFPESRLPKTRARDAMSTSAAPIHG